MYCMVWVRRVACLGAIAALALPYSTRTDEEEEGESVLPVYKDCTSPPSRPLTVTVRRFTGYQLMKDQWIPVIAGSCFLALAFFGLSFFAKPIATSRFVRTLSVLAAVVGGISATALSIADLSPIMRVTHRLHVGFWALVACWSVILAWEIVLLVNFRPAGNAPPEHRMRTPGA